MGGASAERARPEGCALVTGASRGIGAAIARGARRRRLAGRRQLPQRRRGRRARRRRDRGGAAATRARARPATSSTASGSTRCSPALEARSARCSCSSTTPACAPTASRRSSRTSDWDRVLDTNLTAAFRATRRALRPMLRARYGRIVNIASVVGLRANPGQANYAASKAGLIGMTKTVAVEVARRGVTVNAVAPGPDRDRHDRGPRQRRPARARSPRAAPARPRRSPPACASSPPTRPPT